MNSNAVKWISIIVIAVLVLAGIWWLMGEQGANNGAQSNTASSTLETATTTSETSGPGSIRPAASSGTVSQVIASLSLGGHYASLLSSTGVSLSGKGPYTVFVATDGAFSRLPTGTLASMSATDLKRMMEYSIVSGKKLDVDAVQSGQVQAVSGDPINFTVDAQDRVYVNSGYVLQAYAASNGIVYVINSVLLPPIKTQQ